MNNDVQTPPGTRSQDGQFVWTGSDWTPATAATETGWTRPLQRSAAVFFSVSALVSVIVTFMLGSNIRHYYAQTMPNSRNSDSLVSTMANVTIGVSVFFVIVYLVMAVASARGWGWAFWVDLVLFAIGAISAFADLGSLGSNSPVPLPGAIASEVVNFVAIFLLIWFLIALIKYGVWARRKPRNRSAI